MPVGNSHTASVCHCELKFTLDSAYSVATKLNFRLVTSGHSYDLCSGALSVSATICSLPSVTLRVLATLSVVFDHSPRGILCSRHTPYGSYNACRISHYVKVLFVAVCRWSCSPRRQHSQYMYTDQKVKHLGEENFEKLGARGEAGA